MNANWPKPCTPEEENANRRHAACMRMRKHRAARKNELTWLQTELSYLQEKFRRIQCTSYQCKASTQNSINTTAYHVLQTHMRYLRAEVAKKEKLAKLLYSWVTLHYQQGHIPEQPTWKMQLHLLGDNGARQYGYEWLSARVYHAAQQAFPRHHFNTTAVDGSQVTIHLTQDELYGATTIAAIEGNSQHTLFSNFKQTAAKCWSSAQEEKLAGVEIENIHNDLAYYHDMNEYTGTKRCTIIRCYREKSGITITTVNVEIDEKYPLQSHEMRPYGYGWVVFKEITEGVTLVRDADIQYTPVTANGPLNLTQLGNMFYVPMQGLHNANLERLCSVIEDIYSNAYYASAEFLEQ